MLCSWVLEDFSDLDVEYLPDCSDCIDWNDLHRTSNVTGNNSCAVM